MGKIKNVIVDVKAHWKVPYPGRNVALKEIVTYGGGGMGVYMVTTLANAIGLGAGNLLVGSAINIQPMHLQTMSIAATIVGFFFTILRSYLFDNTKSKQGKFRPWIKWAALPTMLSSILFVWMPYERMEYSGKVITVMLCFILINIFSPFYVEAFTMLKQVISPDSDERIDIMSTSQIIYSFAPTVINLFIPFLATFTGGLTSLQTYRMIYPPITFIGLFLSYWLYKGTRERIVYAKHHENAVRFSDGLRDVAKNKYFWITNTATWLGFSESAYSTILTWTFVYAMPDKQQYMGVASTVIGNGALWAMMLTPFLIRRLGKRNLLIWNNVINIFLLAILLPFFNNLWVVLIVCYLNNFINVFSNIYQPGIQADIKDYHQYKTGVRVDGMFMAMGLIGTCIGFGTGYVIPLLYERLGLTSNYDVLFDGAIRGNIFRMLVIMSVIGAVLNVIPYLFYDLTEDKHRGIIWVLKIRAMFEDYGYGELTDEALLESMKMVKQAQALKDGEKQPLPKKALKQARKLPQKTPEEKVARQQAVKDAKAERQVVREHNIDVAATPFILEELYKFNTLRYQKQLEQAVKISAEGMAGLLQVDSSIKKEAKSLPHTTKEERLIRSDVKELARVRLIAKRMILKHYPNGIQPFDAHILEEAENRMTMPGSIKDRLETKLLINRELKKRSIYRRCMKPNHNAVNLVKQAKNYGDFHALEERYQMLSVAQTRESANDIVQSILS